MIERNDEVVCEAHQLGAAAQARLHFSFKPRIEHGVQEDVCQHRRDDSTLWRAGFSVAELSLFHHACVETLADEMQHDPISYPLAKKPTPAVRD